MATTWMKVGFGGRDDSRGKLIVEVIIAIDGGPTQERCLWVI